MIDIEKLITAWEIFRNSNPYQLCSGCEFRAISEPEYCMGQMIEDTITILKKQPEKKESIKKLPCKCGRKRTETWTTFKDGAVLNFFKCPNCGRKTQPYKTHRELVEAWNRMVSSDDRLG